MKIDRFTAVALALVFGLAGLASADDTNVMQELATLKAQVQAQQVELAQLKGDNWLNQQRTEDVKALVAEVLADAETRISMQNNGLVAGHNGNFFLASPDGNFLMNVYGLLQIRYTYNNRDDYYNNDPEGADNEGFSTPFGKLGFAGHIYDPSLRYVFEIQLTDRKGGSTRGTIILGDAFIESDIADGWVLSVGQFNAPFLRENVMADGMQMSASRSLANAVFTVGKTEGVQIAYNADTYRAQAMLHNGRNKANRPFYANGSDFSVAVRGEYLAAGTFDQFDDFAVWSDAETGVLIGGAINYVNMQPGNCNIGDYDLFQWTLDGTVEYEGFGLFGSIVGLTLYANEPGDEDYDLYAYVVQGSYAIIPDKADLFVRYTYLDIEDRDSDFENIGIWTFGGNWYMHKNDAKVTVDIIWIGDEIDDDIVDDVGNIAQFGVLTADYDDQVVLRGQFQIMY